MSWWSLKFLKPSSLRSQRCGLFLLMASFKDANVKMYRSASIVSLGGRNSVQMIPLKSKKTVSMVFVLDRAFTALLGGLPPLIIQTEDCALVSGSKVTTHVLSPVTTLAKNCPGSARSSAKFCSHNLFRKSFCSCVRRCGTNRALLHLKLRSFLRINYTTCLVKPVSLHKDLTDHLPSFSTRSLITLMFAAVLLDFGLPGRGRSLMLFSPSRNLFAQTLT